MSREVKAGQLWSLKGQEAVVCLTEDASSAHPDCFFAVVIHSDGDSAWFRFGEKLLVHTSGLSYQWEPKPRCGVVG